MRALILLISLTILLISGCATRGPIGSELFDPTFQGVIEPDEKILFFAPSRIRIGSFMEGKMRSFPEAPGILIMTQQRWLFVVWKDRKRNYEPLGWISYGDIKRVKKHNNILLQYIALMGSDGSKNTYVLSPENTEKAHALLVEQIKLQYQQGNHGCKGCLAI